ncbi:SKP1 component, dimerization [Pseudocohnilembus persalinus]|uniref:SKP1 component, dimerization n=1 Tax=Pseudocohnilembus persalinus TaxID=266149 RepID=A0A0V0QW21_PSEPJ|nr:SKP1 component, dimerization [Pseudocohnilembus persalinus]|eukprot:KRX06585.1 SKP1 component, dimerization [Pseudocohnilembus persalinus]
MEAESDNEQLTVKVGTINIKTYDVDPKIQQQSGLFNALFQTSGNEYHFEQIEPEEFEKCIEYLEMHNYNPPKIRMPIESRNLEENVCPKDFKFIKDYDVFEQKEKNKLRKLINAATYLQIQKLVNLCVCRIATEFFFGQDQQDYQMLKQKLGVEEDITIQQEKQINKDYPWINTEQKESTK